jgi:adenosylcobinamide amidohydrolase
MARGAQAGYAATLHGNEAVVPLPDNRSIPVTLNGAGGQNNNVVVNVSMDGQGGSQQSSQSNSDIGKNIGAMVASAVQEELQSQKRSGGILNPYGVS